MTVVVDASSWLLVSQSSGTGVDGEFARDMHSTKTLRWPISVSNHAAQAALPNARHHDLVIGAIGFSFADGLQPISLHCFFSPPFLFLFLSSISGCVALRTRNQAVARIADRTAKNCRGHVT